jgi:phospholipid/cholesterol/gamma-HCH transport system substrate-binding protein
MKRIALAASAALGLLAAGCGIGGERPMTLTASFEDVGDLVVNHAVQMADVRVGEVTAIELTDDFRAVVTLAVDPGVDVPADSEAILRQTSLLGEKFIELRPDDEDDPTAGPYFESGDEVERTREAPELEFVAEQAIELLGGVAAQDLTTLAETGASGFGGRGAELRSLVEDLSTISDTLADQTGDIVSIIDGLDRLTQPLAADDASFDQMLVNLAETTTVLADNREEMVGALRSLTELARAQNEVIFDPYLEDVQRQIRQLDGVLAEVAAGRSEVGVLLDWLNRFVYDVPTATPGDFAQVYNWFNVCGLPDSGC